MSLINLLVIAVDPHDDEHLEESDEEEVDAANVLVHEVHDVKPAGRHLRGAEEKRHRAAGHAEEGTTLPGGKTTPDDIRDTT